MTGSSAKILADHNTLLSSPQPPHQDFYRCIGTRFPVTSRWLLTRSNAIHRTRLTLEIHSAALLSKPYLRCQRILQQQPSYNSSEELITGINRAITETKAVFVRQKSITNYRSLGSTRTQLQRCCHLQLEIHSMRKKSFPMAKPRKSGKVHGVPSKERSVSHQLP